MTVVAQFQSTVLAQSSSCFIVGGVYYFPWEAVSSGYLSPSSTRTECPWKGTAVYYNASIDGHILNDAVWYYPNPKSGYEHIADTVAFGTPVRVFPKSSRHASEGAVEAAASADSAYAADASAQNEDLLRFLLELPKTEVHLHLEAMIDVPRLWNIIQEQGTTGYTVRSRQELFERFQVRTLDDFISLFTGVIQPSIRRESDLEHFVYGARDYMTRNNIEYAEMFVAPTNLLSRGMSFERIAETIDSSAKKIREADGLEMRFLVDVSRGFGVENAQRNLELTLANRCDSIIGIGLGGAEPKGPAADFAEVFARAREAGLRTTAHAGEAVDSRSIWEAVDRCKVERIGHGLSAMHDRQLLDYLAEKQVPIEACPSSNVFTGAYVNSIEDHPLRTFYESGIPVSLNTDDPVIFGVELVDEFLNAADYHGFTREDLVRLNEFSIDMSFMSEEKKSPLKARGRALLQSL